MKSKNRVYILLSIISIVGCSSNSYRINKIPPKKETSVVKEENFSQKNSSSAKEVEYHNDFGDDFGYFNQDGYYCNGRFYPYNSNYRYEDRLYRRGYFSTDVKHARVYEESDNGNGYYYPVYGSHPKSRVFHPEHVEEMSIGSGSYSNLKYK